MIPRLSSKLEPGTPELTDVRAVEYSRTEITERTREMSERTREMSVKYATGRRGIYKTREYEERSKRILNTPLP